ncbi:MAG: glycosyl transferase UDP-glucuronosyltransferase [Rhodocyclaceae bacterium]|nr:glycosyl transferase UDP-glucuronosyltransferase [Rhodocyclaceae bacterium]
MAKTKVLFFAEGATLAHVARPLVLARALDPSEFDVVLARPASFAWVTKDEPFGLIDLRCQSAETFGARLDRGRPLYDLDTLTDYVRQDLEILEDQQPDAVVGDFRLSLSVSARKCSLPYLTICDAYWSPEHRLHPPLPVFPVTRFLPISIAEPIFRLATRVAFPVHARPMRRLRERFGLPSLGVDLRQAYTDADVRLFANFERLFPAVRCGERATFIGPVNWSPAGQQAPDLPNDGRPLAYVTMGSSGDPAVLGRLVPALESAGLSVVVATAGKPIPAGLASSRTRIFDFVPGDLLCRHARIVVCNGGSPTTSQALVHGVPVLGIAKNMDQFLNMRTIEAYGAGLTVRSDKAGREALQRAIVPLLEDPSFRSRATTLAESYEPGTAGRVLAERIQKLCAG